MAVHIVVDGYNVIGQSPELSTGDIETDREELIGLLAAYRKVKPHKITVVFDAAAVDTFASRRMNVSGIDVRFTETGQLADTVIKNMARNLRERALVVSSDREVAGTAREAGAAHMESAAFTRLVAERLMADAAGDEEPEPREWSGTRKKGPSRRPGKKARRALKRREKL